MHMCMNWDMLRFDWARARAFLATAETGSLSAAARVLKLAQPTVGRQVEALERELDVTLFERIGKRLVVTPAGLDLLEHVRAMGEAAQRVVLTASGQSQSLDGPIRITAGEAVSAYILPPVLETLRAAHPEIDGIWCDGAQVGAGAIKALLDAGRPLVPVTGDDYNGMLKLYDAEKDSHPGFDIGLMSEPTWQGIFAMRAAVSLLKGEEVPKQQILEPQLITAANYRDYIRPDLPDGVFTDTSLSDAQLRDIFGA